MPAIPPGVGGSLGNLYVVLSAESTRLVAGMKAAEAQVAASSAKMGAQLRALSLGAVGALTAIGAASVYQFSRFDKAMTQSLAIMGDVNSEMRDEMARTARQIATETTTSAEQLAEAYYFLASAGLDAEQSIAALSTVNTFAIAGQFDMARATDLLTDAQSALGLTVKDSTQNMENMRMVGDLLVKTNTLANASVEQFSTALTREAGAAMKTFNMDLSEGLAVLAAFADQGVKAELAGTSFARILRLMTAAAVNNADAYEELNVRVFDAQGNLRNMADIVLDLENALMGMADEERTAALQTLGFQARVQGVILPLLGTSEAIREYESDLNKAGGTMDDVANKQMQNFIDQLTITWHRIEEIFLIIGEELTPVLGALNNMLQDLIGTSDDLNDSMGTWKDNVGPAFLTVVGLIGDAIYGLRLVILGLQIVFGKSWAFLIRNLGQGAVIIEGYINQIIKAWNKIPGAVKISTINASAYVKGFAEALDEQVDKTVADFDRLAAMGKFSTRLNAEYDKALEGIKDKNEELVNDVEGSMDRITKALMEVNNVLDAKLAESVPAGMSSSKATGLVDEIWKNTYGDATEATSLVGSPLGGDPLLFQAQQLQEQAQYARDQLQVLREIDEEEVNLTAETQERKLALIENYNEQLRALHIAQAQLVLGSAQQIFDDLAGITEGFAGKQSGIYKAMFAASKAFAIADATVKIAQGIAGAATAEPWFMKIPAIASVVAATASIIGNIQAVQLEFGGGKATGGPVTPGTAYMVGEKGPEMFTPGSSGNIIPNDAFRGNNVSVVVNNYTNAQAEVRETETPDGRQIEVMVRRVKNEMASEVREGRGDFNKSLQNSYGLKRRGS